MRTTLLAATRVSLALCSLALNSLDEQLSSITLTHGKRTRRSSRTYASTLKVNELHAALASPKQHIGGLDIAMDEMQLIV